MRSMTPMAQTDFDTAPFRFVVSKRLHATPEAVFVELGDPSLWFPLMRRSVWRTGATSGVDAQREVDVAVFGKFRERMLVWEPGKRVAFTMTATTSPLVTRMAEDWRLRGDGEGVHLEWIVAATPTMIGRPITPALRAALRAMFALAASGLQRRTAWSTRHGKQPS